MNTHVSMLLDQACLQYSRTALAEALHVDPKTITRWRTGKNTPPLYLVPALQAIINQSSALRISDQPLFTFIDLFAGIGGVRLGFEAAGGQCVFTSEWDAMK
jgi:DNA (cytosine-5)-methyltransferase 1